MENGLESLVIDYASEQGHRFSNEDTEINDMFKVGGINFKVLGVFDGHGGDEASKIIQNELVEFLSKTISGPISIEKDIEKTCNSLNNRILKDKNIGYAGSCGLFSLIWFDEVRSSYILTTANIGDSRGVIISNSKLYQLNKEHKPHDQDEKIFIEQNGGEVLGVRLNGQLAVSRAFGDIDFVGKGLRVTPDVYQRELSDRDEFLVLACDGLWDVLSNDDVLAFILDYVSEHNSIADLSSSLIKEALNAGTRDNVTVIVCDLRSINYGKI